MNKMALGSHALPLPHGTLPLLPTPPCSLLSTFPTQLPQLKSQSHTRPIPCSGSPLLWHFARKQEARYRLREGREGELSLHLAPPCSDSVPHQ